MRSSHSELGLPVLYAADDGHMHCSRSKFLSIKNQSDILNSCCPSLLVHTYIPVHELSGQNVALKFCGTPLVF